MILFAKIILAYDFITKHFIRLRLTVSDIQVQLIRPTQR
jgi:hypothetical protein